MKKKIQIDIANPCSANWSALTVTEKGRFCADCEKEVIDFSNFSDSQLLNFIQANKNQKTCGRFHSNQLDRPLIQSVTRDDLSYFSLRAVLFGATLSSFFSIENAYGQSGYETLKQSEPITNWQLPRALNAKKKYNHTNENKIVGTILTLEVPENRTNIVSKSYPSSRAEITLLNELGNEIGKTYSDQDGKFFIDLDWKLNPVYIKVEQFGTFGQRLVLDQIANLKTMEIVVYLENTLQFLGSFEIIEK